MNQPAMILPDTFSIALQKRFGVKIVLSESMAKYTTYGVGGPVDALVFVDTLKDIEDLVLLCRRDEVPYFVLGAGSNLLVPDHGVKGVGIYIGHRLDRLVVDAETGKIRVMAGCRLGALYRRALEESLGGLEFTIGIPGTVGGAVMMNAGTRQGEMADVVTAVTLVDGQGRIRQIDRENLRFSYRRLSFPENVFSSRKSPLVIVEVILQLHREERAVLIEKTRQISANRKASQPMGGRSAGCFFKNPAQGPGAGALIDGVGLKGRRIGGAQISPVHANFIINTGGASAADILALARLARDTVAERCGILLEPEVMVVGGADDTEQSA